MSWYQKIKKWFDAGSWNETMVRNAVVKGKITQAECDDILEGAEQTQSAISFAGLTVADVLRSLNKKATLDELRQACDWLNIPWDRTMTRAQLRALIEAAAEAE